ncbi:hypothetical protein Emed_001387 [Eimeria media]
MGYNPTYGGQFQGLRASAQKTTGTAKGGAGAAAKAGGGGPTSVASQGSGGQGSGSASSDPGEKVVVTLGGLKQVHLESLNEGDELFFIVVGLFEGDDLNNKYHHSTAELRLVDGGDPSIKPGKLEVAIDVCKSDSGPPVPPDNEE